jgi:hypothetical protein
MATRPMQSAKDQGLDPKHWVEEWSQYSRDLIEWIDEDGIARHGQVFDNTPSWDETPSRLRVRYTAEDGSRKVSYVTYETPCRRG